MSDGALPQPAALPGWYPDNSRPNSVRYWDGQRWTDAVAPAARTQPVGADTPGLEVAGWITAFLFPIVGVVIGMMLSARPEKNSGGWILAVSICWMVLVWFFLSVADTSPA